MLTHPSIDSLIYAFLFWYNSRRRLVPLKTLSRLNKHLDQIVTTIV
ncbi:hypothetical protein SAMN05216244_1320 [Sediminibacillus halophilus]|uniref:Uncharacterized protein n=1 Tax=Sediminibacillus halophilus TaxID=482461 RepID=A0A1G9P7J6_9BACI|nr:hypothetical protein SAMN05216244_1320 [Sediminibacillus halophilus]